MVEHHASMRPPLFGRPSSGGAVSQSRSRKGGRENDENATSRRVGFTMDKKKSVSFHQLDDESPNKKKIVSFHQVGNESESTLSTSTNRLNALRDASTNSTPTPRPRPWQRPSVTPSALLPTPHAILSHELDICGDEDDDDFLVSPAHEPDRAQPAAKPALKARRVVQDYHGHDDPPREEDHDSLSPSLQPAARDMPKAKPFSKLLSRSFNPFASAKKVRRMVQENHGYDDPPQEEFVEVTVSPALQSTAGPKVAPLGLQSTKQESASTFGMKARRVVQGYHGNDDDSPREEDGHHDSVSTALQPVIARPLPKAVPLRLQFSRPFDASARPRTLLAPNKALLGMKARRVVQEHHHYNDPPPPVAVAATNDDDGTMDTAQKGAWTSIKPHSVPTPSPFEEFSPDRGSVCLDLSNVFRNVSASIGKRSATPTPSSNNSTAASIPPLPQAPSNSTAASLPRAPSNSTAASITPLLQVPPSQLPLHATDEQVSEEWIRQQCEMFKHWLNFTLHPLAEQPPQHSDAPLPSLLAHRHRALVSGRAQTCFQTPAMQRVREAILTEIRRGKLALRPDDDLSANVGRRQQITDLLLSYSTPWLRLGLETLFDVTIWPEVPYPAAQSPQAAATTTTDAVSVSHRHGSCTPTFCTLTHACLLRISVP
jgi:hypothetical protein